MRHVQREHIVAIYICNLCQKQYNNAVHIELHMDNHLREEKTNRKNS